MNLPVVTFHFCGERVSIITFSAFMFYVRMLDSIVFVQVSIVRCFVVTLFTLLPKIILDLVIIITARSGQCILNRLLAKK